MNETVHSEPIRAWFERKTKKIRKSIFWFSIVAVIGSVVAFAFMPEKYIATLQVFNGAMTIPVFGGIWMVSFIFMFLLPSREAGFRSQEGIDEAKTMLAKAIDEKVGPAMDVIRSVAGKVDAIIESGLVGKFQSAVEESRKAIHERIVPAADCLNRVAQRIEASIVNAKLLDEVREAASAMGALCRKYEKAGTPDAAQITKFMEESKPVLAMLQKVQKRFESDFNEDFLSDLKGAIKSVRELGGIPLGPSVKPSVKPFVKPFVKPDAGKSAEERFVPAQDVSAVNVNVPVVASQSFKGSREPDIDRALTVLRRSKKVEVKV
jgi:hypothetical protein